MVPSNTTLWKRKTYDDSKKKKEWREKERGQKQSRVKNLPLSLTFNIQTVKCPQLNKGALTRHSRRQENSKYLYIRRGRSERPAEMVSEVHALRPQQQSPWLQRMQKLREDSTTPTVGCTGARAHR